MPTRTRRTPKGPGGWPAESVRRLEQRIADLTAEPGTWSVVVSEGGLVLDHDGARPHVAASTIKLPLLLAALRLVELGRLDLDTELVLPGERAAGAGVLAHLPSVGRLRLGECLDLMTTISDNTAANLVIDALGGLAAAARAIEPLALPDTRLERRLAVGDTRGENRTTARDLARCLELVLDPSALGERSAALAQDLLGRQTVNDRLPALLDDDVRCLHKTGELLGVRHDAGVLAVDGRAVVVVVLGSDLTDADTDRVETPSARRVAGGCAAAVVDSVRA